MAEETILIGISQLALIFNGFVAIFLVYVRQDGRFSPADSLRIASIIFVGFVALFAALIPLGFWSFGLAASDTWQYSAIVWFVIGLPSTIIIARRQMALSSDDRKEVGYIHTTISWTLNFVSILLIIYIALGFGGAGEYVLALLLMLAIATTNFITISMQKLL